MGGLVSGIILAIYVGFFIQAVRTYGWGATLAVLGAMPFFGVAFLCVVFPETESLGYVLAVIGAVLLVLGIVGICTNPIARARRIVRRQQRLAERRSAMEIIDKNQRLRGR